MASIIIESPEREIVKRVSTPAAPARVRRSRSRSPVRALSLSPMRYSRSGSPARFMTYIGGGRPMMYGPQDKQYYLHRSIYDLVNDIKVFESKESPRGKSRLDSQKVLWMWLSEEARQHLCSSVRFHTTTHVARIFLTNIKYRNHAKIVVI